MLSLNPMLLILESNVRQMWREDWHTCVTFLLLMSAAQLLPWHMAIPYAAFCIIYMVNVIYYMTTPFISFFNWWELYIDQWKWSHHNTDWDGLYEYIYIYYCLSIIFFTWQINFQAICDDLPHNIMASSFTLSSDIS